MPNPAPELITLSDVTMTEYVDWLNRGVPWSLSRWGDGEIRSLLAATDADWLRLEKLAGAWKKGRRNKSGHSFPAEMGNDMRALLRSRPKHRLSLAGRFATYARKPNEVGLGSWLKTWLKINNLEDLMWDHCDLIVKALIKQQFGPFLEAIRGSNVVVVGPAHLKKLKAFEVKKFIEVPRRDAYLAGEFISDEVKKYLNTVDEHTVVSVSMGPAAPLLVESLWGRFQGKHTIIDLGSLWDMFVGEKSRSYMARPDIQEYVASL